MVAFSNSNIEDPSHSAPFRGHSRAAYDMIDHEIVSILGADSPLGQQIATLSLRCGYKVQALTRGEMGCSPNKNLRILTSDTLEARHIRTVVQGSAWVINLLNLNHPKPGPNPSKSVNITRSVLETMTRKGPSRYLCVTHQAVRMPGDRFGLHGLTSRYLWPLAHRQLYRDLQDEADLLSRSNLSWTLVRCPTIKDVSSFGAVHVNRHCPTGRFISLERLARYLVHLKDSATYSQKAIFVSTQPTRVQHL